MRRSPAARRRRRDVRGHPGRGGGPARHAGTRHPRRDPDALPILRPTTISSRRCRRLGGPGYNDMRVRQACLPSANGHFSARALAKMYARWPTAARSMACGWSRPSGSAKCTGCRPSMPESRDPRRPARRARPSASGWAAPGRPAARPSFMGTRRTAFGHPGRGRLGRLGGPGGGAGGGGDAEQDAAGHAGRRHRVRASGALIRREVEGAR